MMKAFTRYLFVLAAFLVVFFEVLTSFSCHGAFTFKGSLLVDYSYKTVLTTDWFQCLSECVTDSQCLSYNFESKGFGARSCELNDCAFKSRCEAEEVLIKTSGFVFHQLYRFTKTGRTCGETKKTRATSPLSMRVSCSQRVWIFVDGVQKTLGMVTCPLNTSLDFPLTAHLKVIALKSMDDTRGQPGLVASLSNGIATDTSWKCTPVMVLGWEKTTFDDSSWPDAIAFCNNSKPVWPLRSVGGISDKAEWIWSDNANVNRHVYCRKNFTDRSFAVEPFKSESDDLP